MTRHLSRITILLMLAVCVPHRAAHAHPHARIDLRSAVLFTEDGKIAGLEEEWLLDEQYTQFNVQVLGPAERSSKQALTALVGKDLERIRPLGYFTTMSAGRDRLESGTVSTFAAEMRGKRLWLRFVLPLVKPFDPHARPFTFWIADPTYWIEMIHTGRAPVALRGEAAKSCRAKITPPHPSPELIAKAAALDVDGRSDPTLGQQFAEMVTIDCPPRAAP
jgi:ABC-type uncharacterized transport system substrate-binding protein